jgi:hypothetical protein
MNAYTGVPSMYKPDDQRRDPEQEKADRERQQKQWAAVKDYAAKHRGMSHRSAFHILQQDRPDLFSDGSGMTPDESEDLRHSNQKKQNRIHAEIQKLRGGRNGSKITFARAWNELRKSKPHLFNFDEAPGVPQLSRPYAQPLPGVQQPASAMLRAATVKAEQAIADGAPYIELRAEDVADLLSGMYD